jgi:hypothetical protein
MNPKRRRMIVSLASASILALCLFGILAMDGVMAKEPLPDTGTYYIVRQGDTLWDITSRFYADPFLWPVVWSYNAHIANPHWIYPGDPIYLASIADRYLADMASVPGAAAPAGVQPAAASAVPSVPTLYISRRIADTALLTADSAGETGRVLAAREDKILLAQGDEIYIQLPDPADAAYEGPYQVLRALRNIRHPQTAEDMGTLYGIMGYAMAVGHPRDGVARGIIVASQDSIEAGDLVRRGGPPPREILSNPASAELEGCIVAGLTTDDLLAEYDVVFIDRGIEEGVEVGDTFWVLEPVRKVGNPSGLGSVTLPDTRMAVLVVIHAERGTSTALVTNSQGTLSAGYRVRARTE